MFSFGSMSCYHHHLHHHFTDVLCCIAATQFGPLAVHATAGRSATAGNSVEHPYHCNSKSWTFCRVPWCAMTLAIWHVFLAAILAIAVPGVFSSASWRFEIGMADPKIWCIERPVHGWIPEFMWLIFWFANRIWSISSICLQYLETFVFFNLSTSFLHLIFLGAKTSRSGRRWLEPNVEIACEIRLFRVLGQDLPPEN